MESSTETVVQVLTLNTFAHLSHVKKNCLHHPMVKISRLKKH